MTLSEQRRDNLNQWFEYLMQTQFQTGKAICEHYGLSVAEVSQLLNSHRPISQKTARLLEQQLQLPDGALDSENILQQYAHPPALEQLQNIDHRHHDIQMYEMARVEKQAFHLILSPEGYNIDLDSQTYHPNDVYGVRIVEANYAPMLNVGWTVLCNRSLDIKMQDWGCVKLVNNICLFLQFLQSTQTHHYFQSLDQQKAVNFACTDVLHMDPIVMIYTRSD